MNEGSQGKLWRMARTLKRMRPREKRKLGRECSPLPGVFFVTDPNRTPDLLAIAMRLPRGTGVIFRGFGRPGAEALAAALAGVARRRGLVLLIGADAKLAMRVGAAGVHLPERLAHEARRLKALHPRWRVTVAAHSPEALACAKACGADAVLYSAVFDSRSPSAGRAVGPVRLALAIKGVGVPVFALGGVNASTAARLTGTGVAGFAAVEAFSKPD